MHTHHIEMGRSDQGVPTSSAGRMSLRGLLKTFRAALKRHPLIVHFVKSSRTAWNITRTALSELRWTAARRVIIRDYLDSHHVRKLQMGCGDGCQDGWLNSDLRPRTSGQIFLDATKRFPFPDATFDYILAEHLVQDLSYQGVGHMLAECARVLRPGGKVRLSTPDLERLCQLYRKTDGMEGHYLKWYVDSYARLPPEYLPGFVLNNTFRELRFVFDRATMQRVLSQEGFENVSFFEPGQSPDPNLRQLEVHGRVLGDEDINRFESLVVEGTRRKLQIPHMLAWAILVTC
jgi:predicted SAM-dependent methyltransferase